MAEVSKKVIAAWRDFAVDPAFEEGLLHLLQNYAPQVRREDKVEAMLHSAIGFNAYASALKDIRDVLTQFPEETPESPTIQPLKL